MIRRFSLFGLWLLILAACQVAPPIQPIPTATMLPPATTTAPAVPTRNIVVLPIPGGAIPTPTWTAQPTLTPTSTPTITATPIPTLTVQPTITPTSGPVVTPVVLIARPLADEFVTTRIPVAGKVATVSSGVVRLSLQSAAGRPDGPAPVLATTRVVSDGLEYEGEITFEGPPTPRLFAVHVEWAPSADAQATARASQLVSLLGRYPRVDRVIVESPQPFERGSAPQLVVEGVAPGPPVKMLARLLDNADTVLESTEAQLSWVQPGLAAAFSATLPNNQAATQLQIISFGPDEQILEAPRVRLAPR